MGQKLGLMEKFLRTRKLKGRDHVMRALSRKKSPMYSNT